MQQALSSSTSRLRRCAPSRYTRYVLTFLDAEVTETLAWVLVGVPSSRRLTEAPLRVLPPCLSGSVRSHNSAFLAASGSVNWTCGCSCLSCGLRWPLCQTLPRWWNRSALSYAAVLCLGDTFVLPAGGPLVRRRDGTESVNACLRRLPAGAHTLYSSSCSRVVNRRLATVSGGPNWVDVATEQVH